MKENLKNFLNKNLKNISFLVVIIILCIVMFIFIDKKEGYHEDEIFSYGSSNYRYGNSFKNYGKYDGRNYVVEEYVVGDNIFETIKNAAYYLTHGEEFWKKAGEIDETPVWKTRQEALEYVSIQKEDILNYARVYYNQVTDVHPPLFYFIVHTVSIFFMNKFSKYIIFIINLVFFIATCFVIRKILQLLQKEKMIIPAVLLYGLSMGAISTVIFHRVIS